MVFKRLLYDQLAGELLTMTATMLDEHSMNRLLLAHWTVLNQGLQHLDHAKAISGYHLDIATVVLVAQWVMNRAISSLFHPI